jgi:hypothetical protein
MFEDQHTEQDMMFKSILESGQEEVPGRVWDGVASELARREKAVLWWKRTAAGVAAAASVMVGVLLHQPSEEMALPSGDAIAVVAPVEDVVEKVATEELDASFDTGRYIAFVPKVEKPAEKAPANTLPAEAAVTETLAATERTATVEETAAGKAETAESAENRQAFTPFPEEWEKEEAVKKHKVKASLTLSANTGANTVGKSAPSGRLNRPMSPNAQIKPGITETGNNSFGLPISLGIGARFDIAPKWSVGVGVNWSMLTRNFDGAFTKVEGNETLEYTESSIRNTQHYIGIPVNVYYNIISNKHINFYTYAGGAVEKGLTNKFGILSSKSVYKEEIQGVQWSANLGLGVEFMFGKHLGLYLDPSVRYYFNCQQPKSIRTAQPFMLGLELGLRTRF